MSKVDKNINNEVKVIDDKDIEVVKPKHIGRPVIYDANIVAQQLNEYTDSIDYPLISEFCTDRNHPSKPHLYLMAETSEALSNSIKGCCAKQEAFVERQVSIGKFNPIFAIFKLKQPAFGWKDKVETENNTKIQLEIMLPNDVKKLSK